MVDDVLYLWLFHADERGGQAQLAISEDHAATWTLIDWKFEEFGLCAFINFGRNYAGARDNYVYTVTHDGAMADGPADRMILMRAPKDQITERDLRVLCRKRCNREPCLGRRHFAARGCFRAQGHLRGSHPQGSAQGLRQEAHRQPRQARPVHRNAPLPRAAHDEAGRRHSRSLPEPGLPDHEEDQAAASRGVPADRRRGLGNPRSPTTGPA